MGARVRAGLAIAFVVGFGGFGVVSADAANPFGFAALVNPLKQLPADAELIAAACTSASHCVAVGDDVGFKPVVLAGDPSSWSAAQMRQISLGSLDKGGSGSGLFAVTCTSPTACVAVGGDGNGQPLVMAGNPATWTAAQAKEITLGSAFGDPNDPFSYSSLYSITCTSSTACVAVGSDGKFQPLVLAGNPSTWTAAQAKEITLSSGYGSGGELNSVTCTSPTSCVAVGDDEAEQPVFLTGDPSTWNAAHVHDIALGAAFGSGGFFYSVTCTSSSSCVAVGSDKNGQPLMLAGDPSSWGVAQTSQVTLGAPFGLGGRLFSVTCTSSSSCIAGGVDRSGKPLLAAGDPSTPWTAAQAKEIPLGTTFKSRGALYSIACASSSTCVATGIAGNNQPLVLAGDPSTWGAPQATQIPTKGIAFGVDTLPLTLKCLSASSCLEIGSSFGFLDASSYLIHGNPATWNTAPAVPMTGIHLDSFINGAACPSATYCVAVGQDGATGEPLVLAGNPSAWNTAPGKVIALGSTFASHGSLVGVSCASTTSCVAVGYDFNDQPLVLQGNPATWTALNARQITLGTTFHSSGSLDSVKCFSATSCVAVGYDGEQAQPLILAGNPSSWSAASAKQITLGLSFGLRGALFSIACVSSTSCVSVGYSDGAAPKPLVLAGNPATWTATSAYNLGVASATSATVTGIGFGPGSGTGYLASISCDRAGYCVAAGGDTSNAPIYIAGNPTSWKGHHLVRPAKNGPSFVAAELTASSCATTACFALGNANGGDFVASFSGG
jgi:hypothetical protein